MTDPGAQAANALSGRYAIQRELGRGGMATVYLAEDLKLHRQLALKVLRPELAASLGSERFHREVEIAARLSHPHILPLHDSGEAGGQLYYAMPYVEGESLRQRLEREGQLPIAETIAIVRAVASALTYAHHHGVIHRDIKPENILLAANSEGGAAHPLVADFGIARALDAAGGERLTETGLALGTPAYMSPEQAASGRLDGRSDIYALGCVAYEMLAGSPPFTGPTAQAILARHAVDAVPPLHTVRGTVPRAVEAAIERALAKVPADRFTTADDFAQALTAVHLAPRFWPGARARRQMRLALASVTAIGLAGLAAAALRRVAVPAVLPSASTIAVLPFSAPAADTLLTRLGRDLATTVSASLDGVGGIETADRLRMAQEIADRPADAPGDMVALGRRLGARSILRGTLVHDGPNVRADLGLYDTEGLGPLARGITITAHRDSLGALTDSVVWALLRQVWQRGDPPSPSLTAVTTRSLPALRAFLDGEREVEKNRWDAAALAYRTAMTADSTFWLAYFRYWLAQAWQHREVEPHVREALYQHRDVFPERDRLLAEAWTADSLPRELELEREVTRRFPDYWPGWFLLGDALFHFGPLLGYQWKDAQSALNRAVALNPGLKPAWLHLFGNSIGKDTVESVRASARLQELEPAAASPGHDAVSYFQSLHRRLLDGVASSGGVIGPRISPLGDSLAKNARELARLRLVGGASLMWFGFPAAQVDFGRRMLRLGRPPPLDAARRFRGIAWAWAERGAWDSALIAIHEAVRTEPNPATEGGPSAVEEYGLAVLGAWLGAIDPAEAISRRPAARTMVIGLGDGERRAEFLGTLAWLNGVLAFARGEQRTLDHAREDGRRSGHPQADKIDRSLSAFGRALAGDRAAAGRELAALEWHSAAHPSFDGVVTPNIAVNRLAAATWLLEGGDSVQAARLLTWHEAGIGGWEYSFTWAVTPLAYLMLARIEEAQGDARSARAHYEQFLRRYDSPMPGQYHLVQEARAGLARLSALGDEPVPR